MKMDRSMAWGCVAGPLLALLILFAVFGNLLCAPFGPYIIQSEQPLGVAEARKLSGFDFPDSARNIRYAHFSEWIALLEYIRFEAPVADCLACAEREIAKYNANYPGTPTPALSRITGLVDRNAILTSELKTEWFDLENIRNGKVGGELGHKVPKVWVDLDRGVFYYMLTD